MKGKSEPPILVKESQREESVSELRASSFSLTEPTPPMPNPTQSKSDWQEALRASINNQTKKVMQATQPHQQDGRDEDVEADERGLAYITAATQRVRADQSYGAF